MVSLFLPFEAVALFLLILVAVRHGKRKFRLILSGRYLLAVVLISSMNGLGQVDRIVLAVALFL